MPQLDSLRAIAVFGVLITHWVPQEEWISPLPLGMMGVTLFFVLSGFLISQIIMNSKETYEKKSGSKFKIFKQFCARRTLRIFPIYYLTILILYIINMDNIREKIIWFIFYASNIYFFLTGTISGPLVHLWTLAVEEQFYIIWPFIILFVPRRHLLKVIIAAILIGPVFRVLLYLPSDRSEMIVNLIPLLSPACMDCFGLGALLAYFRIYVDKKFKLSMKWSLLLVLSNLILLIIQFMSQESVFTVFLFRLNVSVLCLLFISGASLGYKGFLKIIFENKVLMYLGKISYGMYLYHIYVLYLYNYFKLPKIDNTVMRFGVHFVILVAMASLSWYVIENPINKLKRHFSYG